MLQLKIALVGCGKMGGALLAGCIDKIAAAHVIEPHDLPPRFASNPKIFHYTDIESFNRQLPALDLLILAVKPQSMDDVCTALDINKDVLIVSIAAGKTLRYFEQHFENPLVRVMPNTPAAIGKGISVAVAGKTVAPAHKQHVSSIFAPTGAFEWIGDESLMDAVTALSGSGPAYVFWLIEMLAKSGEKQGLPADLAMKLARQTVIGAAALAESENKTEIATLRKNVTSPGGTTEAALKILMRDDVQKIYDDAIAAATKRGKELSS